MPGDLVMAHVLRVGVEADSMAKLRFVGFAKSVIVRNFSPIVQGSPISSRHNIFDILLVTIIIDNDVHHHGRFHSKNIFSDFVLTRSEDIVLRQGFFYNGCISAKADSMGRGFSRVRQHRSALELNQLISLLITRSVNGNADVRPQFCLGGRIGGSYGLPREKGLPSYEDQS